MTNVPLRRKLHYFGKSITGTVKSLPELISFVFRERPDPNSTIVLAGSGRSGTTWLADILTNGTHMQQIFEPLHPYWSTAAGKITHWPKSLYQMRLYYLRSDDVNLAWATLLEKMLSGKLRAWGWTDAHRTCYLPERFLIKVIRANLMLGYLYKQFQPPIVYTMRHPCAVVLSRLGTRSQCDVQDLLAQSALVEDFLSHLVGQIESARSRLDNFAVWWAVENMVAKRQLAEAPHAFIFYEELIMQPRREIEKVLEFLGLPGIHQKQEFFDRPSRTSHRMNYDSKDERLSKWKAVLSEEEQKRIMHWVYMFGLNDYDLTPFPIHSSHDLDDQ